MFKIDEQTATAVLQYLASRPYAEVFQLINVLQRLEKIETPAEVTKKK